MKPFPVLVLVALLPLLGGCRSAYYRTLETFGVHKRDLLVERVEEGKEQQQEAQEEGGGWAGDEARQGCYFHYSVSHFS